MKNKRFLRTLKLRGIGYFIEDTKTGEFSNDFCVTISEVKEYIKILENSSEEEISKHFPKPLAKTCQNQRN